MYYYQVNATNTVGHPKKFFSTIELAHKWADVLRTHYRCCTQILQCALEHHEPWQVILDAIPETILVHGRIFNTKTGELVPSFKKRACIDLFEIETQ